jgi:hypothetical protein
MSKLITITVFSKQRTANDGKKFKTYFATLPGDEKPMKVKFREACGAPECPAKIDLMQGECNISKETYTDVVTGEVKAVPVLWVSNFTMSKEAYRDTSMDKYF